MKDLINLLTIKLDIVNSKDSEMLKNFQNDYTFLSYKLYNNPHLMADKEFYEEFLTNSYMDKSMYDFCVGEVQTKLNQRETNIKTKKKRIDKIEKELSKTKYTNIYEKRRKYKLQNKLAELKRNIYKDCTFGGKALLREITKLSQKPNKTQEEIDSLALKKLEFTKKRNLPIYLVGRACENGNRKVDFDLTNNKIVFKPNSGLKIEIEFNVGSNEKKRREILDRLQAAANGCMMPLSVKITTDEIFISYDEAMLNGYNFDKNAYKRELKENPGLENKKLINKKYAIEKEQRMLVGKIGNRYIAVDLNPMFIGICVFEMTENGEQKILYLECIDLTHLKPIKGLASSDPRQKRRLNKRKFEITEAWKHIFNVATHYKVANFGMEDLDFEHEEESTNTNLNKQTKNLWHRTLTEQLITKYTNSLGIKLIKVNPCYSSFIGNMTHKYFDPISSSLEIGRRAMVKYIKGSNIYPDVSGIDQEKLDYLLGKNTDITGLSWKKLYNTLHLSRYRNPLDKTSGLVANYLRCEQSRTIAHKCLHF